MNEDPRCCGSGACIIDNEGRCWCGQQWDGKEMCCPSRTTPSPPTAKEPQVADKDAD